MVATVATAHPIKARKPFESFLFECSCLGGGLVWVDCDALSVSSSTGTGRALDRKRDKAFCDRWGKTPLIFSIIFFPTSPHFLYLLYFFIPIIIIPVGNFQLLLRYIFIGSVNAGQSLKK